MLVLHKQSDVIPQTVTAVLSSPVHGLTSGRRNWLSVFRVWHSRRQGCKQNDSPHVSENYITAITGVAAIVWAIALFINVRPHLTIIRIIP